MRLSICGLSFIFLLLPFCLSFSDMSILVVLDLDVKWPRRRLLLFYDWTYSNGSKNSNWLIHNPIKSSNHNIFNYKGSNQSLICHSNWEMPSYNWQFDWRTKRPQMHIVFKASYAIYFHIWMFVHCLLSFGPRNDRSEWSQLNVECVECSQQIRAIFACKLKSWLNQYCLLQTKYICHMASCKRFNIAWHYSLIHNLIQWNE